MNEFFRPFFSDVACCSFFCCHFSVFLYKITINTSVNFVFLQPRAIKNQLSVLVFLFLWRVVLLIYLVVYKSLFDVVCFFLNQIFFQNFCLKRFQSGLTSVGNTENHL